MTPTQKPGVQFFRGIPLMVPNTTYQGDGFHISYNNTDIWAYGCATTALVPNDHSAFYILNGDHRTAYLRFMNDGLDACLAYFRQNADRLNKRSDRAPAIVA